MKYCIYDIETIKNICTLCFLDYESKKKKSFCLYGDNYNELDELVKFLLLLRKCDYYLVGFKNLTFDSQIIDFIINNYEGDWRKNKTPLPDIISEIHDKSQRIINLPREEEWKVLIPFWKLRIPQIDLFKQKHYDRKEKATSLKWVQFTMQYPTVEEMPIRHDAIVQPDQIDKIFEYNWNDVDSTAEFFKQIFFETELRESLSKTYNLPLLNASEPKMVRDIFGKLLCEEMKIPYRELKKKQSVRETVKVDEIIFPYINFETQHCNDLLDWFSGLNVEVSRVVDDEKADNPYRKKFKFAQCDCVAALGGIHGCIKSGVYKASGNFTIKDIDVVSFYPNLAIENNIKPEHLGESFNKIYKNIFEERKKIPKSDPMNYVYKIILNSAYGLSREKNTYLYDPKFTYSITVNGQLTIIMLAERLLQKIPDIVFYQMNTDGITVGYDLKYTEIVNEILKWFNEVSKLSLEEASYKELIIRDVNNYIGIYDKEGKEPKKKGAFETLFDNSGKRVIEHHKNPSWNIVPIALERYFVNGEDYRKTVLYHDNVYDFLGAVKEKSNFDINLEMDNGEIIPQQKVTRFFASNNGGSLVKNFHDGRNVGILKDWKVSPAYNITEEKTKEIFENINYHFYISEIEKVLAEIEGKSNLTIKYEL